MTPIYDTLIIGAGIAGASLGYRLAGQQRVLLIEREAQPGYHSTGRSAAMFMEAYGTAQIQALTRASRAFYEAPPEGFCEHPLLEPRGCLYVASVEQRELLEQAHAQNLANGTEVSLLDRDAALALVPSLRSETLAGAVLEPGAMDLDVHACTKASCAVTALPVVSCAATPSWSRPCIWTTCGRWNWLMAAVCRHVSWSMPRVPGRTVWPSNAVWGASACNRAGAVHSPFLALPTRTSPAGRR